MSYPRTFMLVAAACALLPVHAAEPVVLKSGEVTESALIDALAVPAPESAGVKTRGFRPAAAPGAATKPPGPGQASLLITFETNSAKLSPESQTALETVAKALKSDALAELSFRIEGHADARGEAELNRQLSQQRAQSVVDYLVGKHGIGAARLKPQGKGSAEPMNKERVDAPENRRVTIVTIRG